MSGLGGLVGRCYDINIGRKQEPIPSLSVRPSLFSIHSVRITDGWLRLTMC